MKMYAVFKLFILIFLQISSLLICGSQCSDWNDLTFCTILDPLDSYTDNLCKEIENSTGFKIKCAFSVDRLRCLEQLFAQTADFSVFKAEDLFLAPLLNNSAVQNLVITNEFRSFPTQKYEFDMVVLVSNEVEINSLSDLRGKRLCHPGFDENGWLYDWSEIFSQYFEETVVPEQCDPTLSVFENKVKSLNSFFGSSCKPGSWSPEPIIDEQLKTRYSKLCESCKMAESCSRQDMYWGQTGPLICMTDCHGDVTWVQLQDVHNHFDNSNYKSCSNFSYLCPDGTKQPFDTVSPCVWISRPWPVIVSHKKVSANVSALIDFISSSINTRYFGTIEYNLRKLLGNSFQPIQPVETADLSPTQYLEEVPGYYKASMINTCEETGEDKIISICTNTEPAQEKCNLMADVARVYSIDPKFKCIQADNCFDRVSKGEIDIVIINTEDLMHIYKNYNLKPILYQVGKDYYGLRYSAAIVRSTSTIKRLKELRGKKACFTKLDGLAWNSLLMVLKENSLIDNYCDGRSEILKFFSDVCIIDSKPDDGIRSCFMDDEIYDIQEKIGSLDLNEAQGLRCIVEGDGDVTFIDHNSIDKYLQENRDEGWAKGFKSSYFRSICPYRNSTSHDCYFSKASYGPVLTNPNISRSREDEIVSAFLIISSLLGDKDSEKSYSQSPIFKLFTHYQNEKNVLFESAASKLESADQYSKRSSWINNYYETNLQDLVNECQRKRVKTSNSAQSLLISVPVIIHFLPTVYIFIFSLHFNCLTHLNLSIFEFL